MSASGGFPAWDFNKNAGNRRTAAPCLPLMREVASPPGEAGGRENIGSAAYGTDESVPYGVECSAWVNVGAVIDRPPSLPLHRGGLGAVVRDTERINAFPTELCAR